MFLAWGAEHLWLHNDAFSAIAGSRHPAALVRPAAGVWSDVWSYLKPMFERAFGGEAVHMTGFSLRLERNGASEHASFDFSHTPVFGNDGNVLGVFGVCVETTARVASEQAVLATAERERTRLFEMTRDLFGVATFDGRLLSVNPAWSKQLGRSDEFLLSTPFSEIIHPEDLEETGEVVKAMIAGNPVHQFHVRLLRADGTPMAFAWSAVPEGPGSDIFYTVGRDITEEVASASALARAQAALVQSQKMEALGNLTGGVAHDFNNLLQVVAGNLQLLGKDVSGNEKAERRISNAMAGVNRGANLASQLLAFGRRQPLDPKVVDIGKLVRRMDEMLQRSIGEGIEIETITSGGLWNSLVDPGHVENALLNLVINSRDAMDGFGKLTIEVGNAYIDDTYAERHDDAQPGQYVVLSVTDTGSGMPSHVLDKVFEPFFSTKSEGKASGLGLSMVYGFVKQTGGHVRVYSEVGEGTTVKMYLPRSMQAEDFEAERDDLPIVGGTETILVAEDDEGVRATAVELLQELGYKVLKAPDASAALSIIQSGIPIDLLFTDVVMPGPLKSVDLVKKISETMPEIGVLFTSGYTENSIVHGGRLDAGVQLLSKPYSRVQLARKIRNAIDTRVRDDSVERPAAAFNATSVEQAASPVSILVVEDEMLIRMSLIDMIEELGHPVREAGSAEEALQLLEETVADVVITDLGLPGMTGEVFAQEIRRRWPEIAIVFATGASHAPELDETARTAILLKPFGTEDIRTALAKIA
jgi:PAS domain S-box-containing protein